MNDPRNYLPSALDGKGAEVHEKCEHCGKLQAHFLPAGRGPAVIVVAHACEVFRHLEQAVFYASTVKFVPGAFTVSELRQQRDAHYIEALVERGEARRLAGIIERIRQCLPVEARNPDGSRASK